MPRNAALPTVSTIGLRSGCDNRKCVPTKAAAAAATGPRPSTLVELLDQCRCGRGTTSAMRKGTSPWPHDVNVLDHVQPDHRERRHEEVKSRPFCCRVVVRFRLGLWHEHASARLTSGASTNSGGPRVVPGRSGCSVRGKQLLRCGKTTQLMATERHDAIERRGQFPTDDDRLAEHFGRVLNAAYQIDGGANDREIEPIGGADIAVMDRADVQCDDNVEPRLALHRGVIGEAGDIGDCFASRSYGGSSNRRDRVGLRDRKDRKKTVADEFEDFAAMPSDFLSLRLEQRIEDRDHPLAGQTVGALGKTAQIGRPKYRGQLHACAAADLAG